MAEQLGNGGGDSPNRGVPHSFAAPTSAPMLPQESMYVRHRTRSLIISNFPEELADLSSAWRVETSAEALIGELTIRHPDRSEAIRAALHAARTAAFDEKYAQTSPADDERSLDPPGWEGELLGILESLEMGNAADTSAINVGIGNGREWIDAYGSFRLLVGVDLALQALEAARVAHPEIQPLHADAANLSALADNTFDLYLSLRTYQSTLFDMEPSVREATRVLRPGGIFLASISNAHRVSNGVVRGLLDPESTRVDLAKPFAVANRLKDLLISAGYEEVGTKDGMFEVYVHGKAGRSITPD